MFFIIFLLSAPSQSNTRQSFAINSVVNKRANACIEKLRQRNIKKAMQHWPPTVYMALENMIVERPLRAISVHRVREVGTKANGYVETTSGRVSLATTS